MSARWEIRFTKQAKKDVERLRPRLKEKLRDILLEVLARNPYEGKKLLGDLTGSYSYLLTHKDRIVYILDEEHRIIYIERARTHYGDYDPVTKGPRDQVWYWQKEWRKKELEADEDIAADRITGPFRSGKALIRSLKRKARREILSRNRRRMIQ